MALTNNITLRLVGTISDTIGVASVDASVNKTITSALSGSDLLWTIAGETPSTPHVIAYDLADESLTDPLGNTVNMDSISMIFFRNSGENAMTLGGGADDIDVLADGIIVPVGGVVLLLGDYAVGASADQITVTGTDEGDTYEILVVGIAPEP